MTVRRRALLKHLGVGAAALGTVSFSPLDLLAAEPPGHEHLPRNTPGAQGVSPEAILEFLAAVGKAGQEVHSLMIVRHGQVVAEGWWEPFRSEAAHILNSLSKCFTSTAVGFAIVERRLGIESRVTEFFPEELPENVSENLAALRVKDLLTMSIGHATDSTPLITKEDNWVQAFLSLPIEHPPGSAFLYDSGGSYMLSAIVQKLSGQRVIDYLNPRFFEPLGIRAVSWQTCPRGINTGGWGMSATTETLSKLGQFYLQRGLWNGVQLLPAAWVDAATSKQISTAAFGGSEVPEWQQGYGYQFWRCRHNAYRGDGAGGQLCIVLPEQDAVIAMTSQTADIQGLLNLVWEHLLPAMRAEDLRRDLPAERRLKRTLASLALPPPSGSATSAIVEDITGKNFSLEPNRLEASSASFEFSRKSCMFRLTHGKGVSEVRCGFGKWADSTTIMFEPTPVKVAAAAAWKNNTTLEMHWCFPSWRRRLVCRFDGDAVSISEPESSNPDLTGRMFS